MVSLHSSFASTTRLTCCIDSLDTRYSLESCGGCSSMGEFSAGVNCLALPNSSGVGCDNGTCVVFSCKGTLSHHCFDEISLTFFVLSQLPPERQRNRLRSSDEPTSSVQRQRPLARRSIAIARIPLDFRVGCTFSFVTHFRVHPYTVFIIGCGPHMCSIELSY